MAITATADVLSLKWGIVKHESPSRVIFDTNHMIEIGTLIPSEVFQEFKIVVSTELEKHINVLVQYFIIGAVYHGYEAEQSFEWAKTKTKNLWAKHPYMVAHVNPVTEAPAIRVLPEQVEEVRQREYAQDKNKNPVKDVAFRLWSTNRSMKKVDLVRLIAKEAKITEANARYYIDRVFEKDSK